jgi:shikimate kinase
VGDETPMLLVIRRFGQDRKRKKMPDVQSLIAIRTALGQRSVVLVGLMGCGKSAIGRRLAAKLGLPFVDADEEIEKAAGKSIEDIFTDHGEPYFRDGERKVLARLLRSGPQVLATGGGAFMNEETRAAIAENGVSVWLKAELPLLVRRVGKRGNRPLLRAGDPETVLQNLMTTRYPVYALADITIESRDVPHEVIVAEIIERLGQNFTATSEVAR